jgi:hypothetical protein
MKLAVLTSSVLAAFLLVAGHIDIDWRIAPTSQTPTIGALPHNPQLIAVWVPPRKDLELVTVTGPNAHRSNNVVNDDAFDVLGWGTLVALVATLFCLWTNYEHSGVVHIIHSGVVHIMFN